MVPDFHLLRPAMGRDVIAGGQMEPSPKSETRPLASGGSWVNEAAILFILRRKDTFHSGLCCGIINSGCCWCMPNLDLEQRPLPEGPCAPRKCMKTFYVPILCPSLGEFL